MRAWRVSAIVVAFVGLCTVLVPTWAQDDKEVKLEFKAFNSGGSPFYQELVTETTQTMKVMGQEVQQKQEQTFYIEWTPQKSDGKDLVVEQKIIGVKMKIDIGGNTIAYDSTAENQPQNPMTDFFNALKSLKLTLVIDPAKMTVKEVKGQKEFVKSLGDTNPQMKPLLENILSEDAIKKMAQPTWGAVPTTAVKKGSTWKDNTVLKLGAIGTYDTKFDYTYEGQEKGKDKIGVKASLSYQAPDTKDNLPFTIKKEGTQLSSKEGSGTVFFNRDKGRIESSTMNMKLEGDLVIEVGGMSTTVNLVQNQSSKMSTMDNNPLQKEATKK